MPAEQDLQTAARPQPQSRQAGHVAATCMLALLLSGSIGAHAKRLVAFGDSITDNGNGTRVYVHRWFAALLERTEPFTVVSPTALACPLMSTAAVYSRASRNVRISDFGLPLSRATRHLQPQAEATGSRGGPTAPHG